MTKMNKSEADTRVSLIERAGIVFIFFIALGLSSLISSMFVIESLEGDAAQINVAGSLRMQSIRVSRALSTRQSRSSVELKEDVSREVAEFERRLTLLVMRGLSSTEKDNVEIERIHTRLKQTWETIKERIEAQPIHQNSANELIDEFVNVIDSLVLALQHDSEKKVRTLRIIHGSTLFLTLVIASVALFLINRNVVQPMNQLVTAAREAGEGNFSIHLNVHTNDEIGALATTFNDMSKQLSIKRDELEDLVRQKTNKLEQSNRSLELLYRVTHDLALPDKQLDLDALLSDIEKALGSGCVHLKLDDISLTKYRNSYGSETVSTAVAAKKAGLIVPSDSSTDVEFTYPIDHQGQKFGQLRYVTDSSVEIEQWQIHLLQNLAGNIAAAISLEKKRSQEDLLLLMKERAVIARELHDSLAQSLSYLKMQTSLLDRQIKKASNPEDIDTTVTDLKEGLSSAYRQLRELLTTFRLEIEEPTLLSALKGTAVEFSSKCQHPVELNNQTLGIQLTPNEQIHVLQIVREALANIQRHAMASHAWIELKQDGNEFQVAIRDNGIGLPKVLPKVGHYGSTIMTERAQLLNAKIDLYNADSGGTIVKVTFVPVNNSNDSTS